MASKPMSRGEKWLAWCVVLPLSIVGFAYCTREDPANPRPPVLNTSKPVYIASDSGHRPIMKSREALDRAQKLIADGVAEKRPDMLRELVACRVPVGTRVSHQGSAGWTAERVVVAEGRDVGCEGYVWSDWLSNFPAGNSTARPASPATPAGHNVPPHAR